MSELRNRFTPRIVMALMQCAGNRRADLHRLRPVTGDLWGAGAIGNAM
jgi:sulfite oxidase